MILGPSQSPYEGALHVHAATRPAFESGFLGSPPCLLSVTLLHPGGVFKLELFLPEEYPMAAPKVTCCKAQGSLDLH
jgi:ubiquitin-protein ligase